MYYEFTIAVRKENSKFVLTVNACLFEDTGNIVQYQTIVDTEQEIVPTIAKSLRYHLDTHKN